MVFRCYCADHDPPERRHIVKISGFRGSEVKRRCVLRLSSFQDDDVRLLCVALDRNASLTSIDLRMNDISADLEDLDKIEVRKTATTL